MNLRIKGRLAVLAFTFSFLFPARAAATVPMGDERDLEEVS